MGLGYSAACGLRPSAQPRLRQHHCSSRRRQSDPVHAHEFAKHVNSLPVDRFSATGLAQHIQGFADTAAYRAVAPAVQKVNETADAADAKVAAVKDALSGDGDTASELRNTRMWKRSERLLDSVKDRSGLLSAAKKLVASASPVDLGVLLQELPSYLQARGQADTAWLETAVAQISPALADAIAARTLAQKHRDITNVNAKALAHRVTPPQRLRTV